MPSRTSASPSPPPQRPVASTPGVRAAALQKIFATALASTLKANSYANFSACFPTPAQHCPSALEGVWKQLNTKLEEGCTREFEAILQERNVVEGLNEWDSRIEDARRRLNRGIDGEGPARPYGDSAPAVPRYQADLNRLHTLSAQELYAAHLTPYLQEATQMLESRLQTSQQDNQALMEKIATQRAEIERLVGGIEGVVKDLEGSVEVMGSGMGRGVDGLRAEVWEMEEEVKAAS